MAYSKTTQPRLPTMVQDKKVLSLLGKGWHTKDVAAKLALSVAQIHEAKRRQKMFYAKKRSSRRR